jgi:hypothetical protein
MSLSLSLSGIRFCFPHFSQDTYAHGAGWGQNTVSGIINTKPPHQQQQHPLFINIRKKVKESYEFDVATQEKTFACFARL